MPENKEPFKRGHVVWHPGLFKTDSRPWLVLNDSRHPFYGEEYIVAGITTTKREKTVKIDDKDWMIGGLPRTSYISPWFLTTLKHTDIDRGVGMISDNTVKKILDQILQYLKI